MRSPAVAALAAAIVLAAGCGPVPAATSAPSPSTPGSVATIVPSAPLPSPSPSGPSPTAIAAPTPTAASGWQHHQIAGSFADGDPSAIAWTGKLFVAAGAFPGRLATSIDGVSWETVTELGEGADVTAIAAGPSGVVAVGAVDDRAAAWHSADGRAWTAAPRAPGFESREGELLRMNAVIAGSNAWVAVGAAVDGECAFNCDLASRRAVVWTSKDGLDWVRAAGEASRRDAAMTGIVETSVGYVAVGTAPDPDTGTYPSRVAVWTSSDALTWDRQPASKALGRIPQGADPLFGIVSAAAAAIGDRIAVVGTVGSQGDVPAGVAFWSDDARSWHDGGGDAFLNGQLFSVSTTPGGFIAVGGAQGCGIWTSPDATAWTCAPADPGSEDSSPYVAAASPTLTVVLGLGGEVWTFR